jgi:hypothetical protein
MRPWDPWVSVVGIYFASLMAISYKLFLLRGRGGATPELKLVLAMTLSGIVQLTCYIMFSHTNHLLASTPLAICVASYWMVETSRLRLPRKFRSSFLYCCYGAMFLFAIWALPELIDKAHNTGFYALARTGQHVRRGEPVDLNHHFASLWSATPTDQRVSEAMALINRYAWNKRRIALFITHELTTETLMLAGKANVFPMSNPIQDAISEPAKNRILSFKHDLHEGDMLFIEKAYLDSSVERDFKRPGQELQRSVVERLRQEFAFEEVERTPHGVSAVRLRSPVRHVSRHDIERRVTGNLVLNKPSPNP